MKIVTLLTTVTALSSILLAPSAYSQIVVYNFDSTVADYNSKFTNGTNAAPSGMALASGTGLSGTAGLSPQTGGGTFARVFSDSAYPGSSPTMNTGIFLKIDTNAITEGNTDIGLGLFGHTVINTAASPDAESNGLFNTSRTNFNPNNPSGFMYGFVATLNHTTAMNDGAFTLSLTNRLKNNGTNGTFLSSSQFTVTPGNWYYMELALVNNASVYAATTTLYNSSNAGVIGTSITSTTISSQVNAAFAGDATIYTAFGSRNDSRGAGTMGLAAWDNLTYQIPEPSTYAMIMAGVCALLGIVRKRNR
ncbi:MAG: PEP-CTERM sorting domain-containing protein [Verrucomicrobiota bacterium]|nr:PEP-CTERM sorting domain-containing protein [Verrucomicrobiota bacterium]